MNVLVTGGCGYKGHVLVPKLLQAGHDVTVLDKIWFGNFLEDNDKLVVIEGDISTLDHVALDSLHMNAHVGADFQHLAFLVSQDQHCSLQRLGLPRNPERNRGWNPEVNDGRPHPHNSTKKRRKAPRKTRTQRR